MSGLKSVGTKNKLPAVPKSNRWVKTNDIQKCSKKKQYPTYDIDGVFVFFVVGKYASVSSK